MEKNTWKRIEGKNGRKRRKISWKRRNCCGWADGWRNIEGSSIGCPNASELFLDFLEWVLTKHQRCFTRANVICAKNLLSFEGILKILCYVWLINDQMLSKPLASFYAESLLKNSFTTPLGESLSPPLDLESLFGQDQWTITDDCALLFFLSLFVFLVALWVMILRFSLPFFIYINQVQSSSTLLSVNDSQSKILETWCEWLVKLVSAGAVVVNQ